jgi:peroxiredoxin
MAQTTGAQFNLLSDSDKKVIISYGVLNPHEHGGIAYPAVFIVGKDGRIKYTYVSKDPTDRPPDTILLDEIKKIGAP